MDENKEIIDETIETTETTETKEGLTPEMLALIQSESEKRVAQALKTQEKKYEKELNKVKTLSQLDSEQRGQAEKDMKIQELQEQLEGFKQAQTKVEVAKVLSERNMPTQLVDFIVTSEDMDVEEYQAKIDLLDKLIKKAVLAEVEKKVKGSTPKTGTLGLDGKLTKEQFNKMTPTQQQELFDNNKELYMQVAK